MSRDICFTKVKDEVRVIFTASEDSERGFFLQHLYYDRIYEALLHLAPRRTGYPHNGGAHTLSIMGRPVDVIAWVELVLETFRFHTFPYARIGTVKRDLEALIEDLKVYCFPRS